MMMQLGLRDALYHTATMVHDHMRGDVFLIDPHYEYLFSTRQFTQRRLHRALGIEGVAAVSAMYVGIGAWKNPVDGVEKRILVMGSSPAVPVFDFDGVQQAARELRDADVVLFDAWSRPEFGPVTALLAARPQLWTEIDGRRTRIAGTFPMGPTFASSGHVITSDLNFLPPVSGTTGRRGGHRPGGWSPAPRRAKSMTPSMRRCPTTCGSSPASSS